jgi:streptogramin lyase
LGVVGQIGRITTAGVITEYPLDVTMAPRWIAAGPDGALWFTEEYAKAIRRITTAGVITPYVTDTMPASVPSGITAGPDGALWFTEPTGRRIGRIAVPAAPAAAQGVPALSPWALLLLAALLATAGAVELRRRSQRA